MRVPELLAPEQHDWRSYETIDFLLFSSSSYIIIIIDFYFFKFPKSRHSILAEKRAFLGITVIDVKAINSII